MKAWNRQQLITRDPGSAAFLEYLASLEREIAAGGGGGGGPAAWGSITGTLSSQSDLQLALNGKANTSHTHTTADVTNFAEAVDDRVSALMVAGTNISLTYDDGANTLTIAATGAPARGTATVTVPNNSLEHSQTVTATGVTPSSIVLATIAAHDDADENDAELLDVMAISAAPGTGQITVEMAFATPTAGPIKINWMAA